MGRPKAFFIHARYDSSSAKPLFRRQFTVSSNHDIFPLKISCDPAISQQDTESSFQHISGGGVNTWHDLET